MIPPPYTNPVRLTISNNYGSTLDTGDSWPTSILSGQDGALYIAEYIGTSNTTCIDQVILPTVLSPTAVSVSKFAYIPGPSPFVGLSPILWLDASDPTTLIGSESSITQWRDKSGRNNHGVLAIPTSQGAILIKNALNGLPGLSFPLLTGNGGNPFLCGNLLTGTTYSIFIAVKFAQTVTLNQAATGEWKSYYGSGLVCDTNWGLISTHVSGTTYTKTPGNAVPVDKTLPHVFSGSLSSSSTSPNATFIMGLDGNRQTYTTTVGPNINGAVSPFSVGGLYEGGNPYYPVQGTVHEVIVFDQALTSAQMQGFEAYLGWKWGINVSAPPLTQSVGGCFGMAQSPTNGSFTVLMQGGGTYTCPSTGKGTMVPAPLPPGVGVGTAMTYASDGFAYVCSGTNILRILPSTNQLIKVIPTGGYTLTYGIIQANDGNLYAAAANGLSGYVLQIILTGDVTVNVFASIPDIVYCLTQAPDESLYVLSSGYNGGLQTVYQIVVS
jgi:hypothetical protein